MEISKVTEVFFSPTYSTERIVRLIGEAWEETHQEIDLSRIPKERKIHEFGAQDLIVFGVPSYGGRVPAPAAERFRNLKGQKTPIILLTAFGNRDYDDTLLGICSCGSRGCGGGTFHYAPVCRRKARQPGSE